MNSIIIPKIHCRVAVASPFRPFVLIAGALLLLAAGAVSSCNTTRGLGQDIEKAGDKIQDAANH